MKLHQQAHTSSEDGESSFIIKYTILLNSISLDWKSLVTPKKTSVASTYNNSENENIMISQHLKEYSRKNLRVYILN